MSNQLWELSPEDQRRSDLVSARLAAAWAAARPDMETRVVSMLFYRRQQDRVERKHANRQRYQRRYARIRALRERAA